LGLVEFQGSKENNIIYRGIEAHNFAPFHDANPAAQPEERYKALAGILSKLYAFVSWKSSSDLSSLIGKPVRFRFVLKDADLFALRTGSL
jgi:hypothetical protein